MDIMNLGDQLKQKRSELPKKERPLAEALSRALKSFKDARKTNKKNNETKKDLNKAIRSTEKINKLDNKQKEKTDRVKSIVQGARFLDDKIDAIMNEDLDNLDYPRFDSFKKEFEKTEASISQLKEKLRDKNAECHKAARDYKTAYELFNSTDPNSPDFGSARKAYNEVRKNNREDELNKEADYLEESIEKLESKLESLKTKEVEKLKKQIESLERQKEGRIRKARTIKNKKLDVVKKFKNVKDYLLGNN